MVYIVSFLVPVVIWIISTAIVGIFPFGENIIFTSDMHYQYAGYFEFVQGVLTQGVNPLFSFYKGMGEETLGMMAYYMLSPFNLILGLFSAENITEAVLVINLLKIGACGLTFSIFLKNKFKNNNIFSVIGFSTCYALMAYNIVYQFNIMWLDAVVWLPIIILGIDRIIKYDKSLIFYISLTIGIISNWYIGFMLCLFSALYTFYNLVMSEDAKNNKRVLKKVFIFGVLSGLTSLIVIFPSVLTCLGETPRGDFFDGKTINYVLIDVLSKFVIGSFDFWQLTDSGTYDGYLNLPNLFAGTTVFFLFIIYFFNKSFDKKERILDGVFFLILLFITLCVPLNKIFHVFTSNVWFPYRYSFCITFFMLYISYKSFLAIEKINQKQIFNIFIAMIFCYFIIEKLRYSYIISELIYCTIFMLFAGFIAIKLIKKNEKNAIIVLAAVMCVEMFINTAVYMQKIGYTNRNSFYEERAKITKAIDEIKSKDLGYYRIENSILTDYNAAMGKGFLGVRSSSSMGKDSIRGLVEALGLTRISNNSFEYSPTTKFADNFLGIKYYISDEIKENADALSLGFVVNDSIKNIKDFVSPWGKHRNSFKKQNELVKAATGINKNLYSKLKIYDIKTENLEKMEHDENGYFRTYPSSKAVYSFSFDTQSENDVYLKINGGVVDRARLYVNGNELCEYLTDGNLDVVKLGTFDENERIDVDIEFISGNDIYINNVWVYQENISVYKEIMEKLKTSQLNINNMSGGLIEGDISVEEDGALLFTIPYDKYLKVYIDGNAIETNCVLDSLISVPINKGYHTIKVMYEPIYLVYVSIISGFSILVAVILILLENKKLKNDGR